MNNFSCFAAAFCRHSTTDTPIIPHPLYSRMPFVEINVNDLDFFERLGEGAAGTVYRGRWASKEKIVAIKKLNIVEDEVNWSIIYMGKYTYPPY